MTQHILRNNYRDYILFLTGINTGLRISDLLQLKVRNIKDRTHLNLQEKKTGKTKRIYLNDSLRRELDKYIDGLDDNTYLFISNKGNNKPISRRHAYRVLKEAGTKVGLTEIGTHTMRKTFGYWHYQQYHDVALLQELFNHSAPSVTLRYIGINQDIMDESLKNFSL